MSQQRNRRRPSVEGLEQRCLLAASLSEFPGVTPQSGATDITTGPDGRLWFTEYFADRIGIVSSTTHQITEIPLPSTITGPAGITGGSDGDVWFAANQGFGVINPSTHSVILISSSVFPGELTAGPDGNIWFGERGAGGMVGEISPTTHAITTYALPILEGDIPAISGITTGPDGNIWFAESVSSGLSSETLGGRRFH